MLVLFALGGCIEVPFIKEKSMGAVVTYLSRRAHHISSSSEVDNKELILYSPELQTIRSRSDS